MPKLDALHVPSFSSPNRLSTAPGGVIADVEKVWRTCGASAGGIPDRATIDPIEFGTAALPWIVLTVVETTEPELVLRYRLCGTGIANLMGRDVTGALSKDVVRSDDRDIILQPYLATLHERAPTFWETSLLHPRTGWRPVYRGIWPYTQGSEAIAVLLNLTVPVSLRRAERPGM
ncbi:MAG: PAS domain-containing protein [Alphaproteobacteria bacterium]|nr:PAS domain-containing protein [Alphaproteobacteria bacterium]